MAFTHRNAFIILFTLLHEIMHALSRLIRGNDNYLLNTAEFTKVKNNFLQRIQRKVDFILRTSFYWVLLKKKIDILWRRISLKLQKLWLITIGDFQKAIIDFRNKNIKIIETLSSSAIGKRSNDDIFTINTGCYCAGQIFKNE